MERGRVKAQVDNFDQNSGKEAMNLRRVERSNVDEEVKYYDDEANMNRKRSEFGISRVGNEVKELESPVGDFLGSLRSRPIRDQWDEGSSNHHNGSFHGYDEQERIRHGFGGAKRVENSENDRAELIKKLDELKDLLSRNPRERAPFYFNQNNEPVPYVNSRGLNMGEFYPPPRISQNEFVGNENPNLPQRLMVPPHRPPPRYLANPYLDQYHIPGHHPLDFNKTLAPYQHESSSHHPVCSCFQCYNKNRQIPSKVTLLNPVLCHVGRYNSTSTNSHLHSHIQKPQPRSPIDFGLETGDRAHGHLRSERVCHPITGGAPFLTCCSCFELLKLPRKLVARGKNQQKVRCGDCSAIILIEFVEKGLIVSLATVPKKVSDEGDDVSGETLNESTPSFHYCLAAAETNSCSDGNNNSGHKLQLTDSEPNVLPSDLRLNIGESNERPDFGASDEESPDSGNLQRDVSKSTDLPPKDDQPSPYLDCLGHKDPDNDSSDNFVFYGSVHEMGNKTKHDDQEKVMLDTTSRENSVNDVSVATEMDVPFSELQNSTVSQDSIEVSKEDRPSINKGCESFYGSVPKMGNKTKHDDHEKVILDATWPENSVNDVSVATEMEVPFSEFQNSVVSQDSVEACKEDRPSINKESEFFYKGLLKLTFGNFSRSSRREEIGRPDVIVNGQPMSDIAIKKAEIMAGHIQPGNYWYDYQAGFWGVMGHPCLGIIPPFIEEFNYPMPENCAAGNTSVFINGRELNQKDLDLLAARGLPTTRDKYYIVEISGRVSDEDTGEELDSLGKLAPTVSKAKHGFGMKTPRALAQQS